MKKTITTNATTTTAETIAAAVERLNANAASMTGEQTAAEVARIGLDVATVNKSEKEKAIAALAGVALFEGVPAFWNAYLSDPTFPVLSVKLDKKAGEYVVQTRRGVADFFAIDRVYTDETEKAGHKKRLPVGADFYKAESRFAADIVKAMKEGIHGKSGVSIGNLETAANAVIAALMPEEIRDGVTIRRADIRHLINIADNRVVLDYTTEAHTGNIKARNDRIIFGELLKAFDMRKHGGDYVVKSNIKTDDKKATAKKTTAKA